MTKILIIAYYWPPAGGAGVQRWVKLTKYFNQYGISPHVLTVHEDYASYMQIDKSLSQDVASNVIVYKTKSFEPINYYAKIAGKENVPTAGFSNVNNNKILQKIINAIRSNLFIPDPRRGWNQFAYKKAREIIQYENIKVVITTSPPHSTQLIGLKLKRKLKLIWIADFRDPWTDIFYYKLLGHSLISKRIDRYLEKKVLNNADRIITVSQGFKNLFSNKSVSISDKIDIIPNGFDSEDFQDLEKKSNKIFTICYTGTISDQYNLSSLIAAIKQLQSDQKIVKIKFQIVGGVSKAIKNEITTNKIDIELINTVPHNQITQYQRNADVLLLIIPDVQFSQGIIPGKLFEYLASGNQILCLGPIDCDASKIIEVCAMGQTIERTNKQGIVNYLQHQLTRFDMCIKNAIDLIKVDRFSRENQAKDVSEIIKSILMQITINKRH